MSWRTAKPPTGAGRADLVETVSQLTATVRRVLPLSSRMAKMAWRRGTIADISHLANLVLLASPTRHLPVHQVHGCIKFTGPLFFSPPPKCGPNFLPWLWNLIWPSYHHHQHQSLRCPDWRLVASSEIHTNFQRISRSNRTRDRKFYPTWSLIILSTQNCPK